MGPTSDMPSLASGRVREQAAKERARKKILVAARKFDIEVDEDDKVFRSR